MSEKYALYVGDTINTVSLWVRKDGNEYPIYANTRGTHEWYTFDPTDYKNSEPHSLSEELVAWLADYYRRIYGAGEVKGNSELPEPEWYEVELLGAIATPGITPEQEDLLEWAYNEVESE